MKNNKSKQVNFLGGNIWLCDQYISALSVYLVIIVSLTLYIIIDREFFSPGHGKYIVDGINKIEKGNSLSKLLTITFEGLGMLHYACSISTVIFAKQCKDILTESSHIEGKNVHSKIKK